MMTSIYKQQGMVLVAALVILLALTLIGVSAMGTSTLEERMAANDRDRQIAFQAAEAALRIGERQVEAGIDPGLFNTACNNGLCDCYTPAKQCRFGGSATDYWEVAATWTNARQANNIITEASAPPRYIIEFMGYAQPPGYQPGDPLGPGDPEMYRITALATGQTPSSRVMLQSTYKVIP